MVVLFDNSIISHFENVFCVFELKMNHGNKRVEL